MYTVVLGICPQIGPNTYMFIHCIQVHLCVYNKIIIIKYVVRSEEMTMFILCRFGGAEFPPIIMFKIFIHSGGQGVKYYCGKKVIKPASEVIENNPYLHIIPA